jgi:hypothetical protein
MELRRDLPSGDYDYRIHSDDGQLVFKNRQYIDLKNAVRGDTVVLTVRCEVTGKVALELP